MKRKGWIIVLTLVITVTAAPLLWAGHAMQRDRTEDPLMALVRLRALKAELNLSAAQIDQLREIARGVRQANADDRAAMKANAAEAGLVLLEDTANIAAAEAILDRHEANRRALRANVLNGIADAIEVLTSDQRKILAQKLANHDGGF